MERGSHIQPGTAHPVQRPRRGVIWVFEGYNRHYEPIERPIYMLPDQDYGLTQEQLFNAPHQLQCEVMEAWFRANYEPAPIHIQVQLGAERVNNPIAQLSNEFTDPKTGDVLGGRELAEKLFDEAYVWLPKPPQVTDAARWEAWNKLGALEAELKIGKERQPGIGDNHPPEPIDDAAEGSVDAHEYALAAVAEGRNALAPQEVNQTLARQAQHKLLRVGVSIAQFLAEQGKIAKKEFEAQFWKEVAGSLAKVAGDTVRVAIGGALLSASYYSGLLGKVWDAVRALQGVIPH